jgi:6-phosphogluconolactonase (cycloisomerase 2 family)
MDRLDIQLTRQPWNGATQGASMTAMNTSCFELSNTFCRLAAFLGIVVLSGCHAAPDFNLGGCLVCGPSTQVGLKGTLNGLVGSGLEFQNDAVVGFQFTGATSNGTDVLFAGASFNTAYDLTVRTQPTNPAQTCVVTNGTGTAGTTDVINISVSCTTNPPRFTYVVNRGSDSVSAYTLNAATGALAPIAGSPFPVGHMPAAIAVDPTGSYAYVTNQGESTISAFLIDRSSGALMPVTGSPFVSGSGPTSVAVDPTRSLVYVTNSPANTISVYAITAGSGAITAASGSPYPTGASPSAVAVAPDVNAEFAVFVANQSDGTVSVFGDCCGATLNPNAVPALAAGTAPGSLAIDIANHLYVANQSSNTLSAFASIATNAANMATGSYATGSMPTSVAIAPLDNFLYVANGGSNDVSAFVLEGTTGALTPLAGSPFAAGNQPAAVAIDPTGRFAYVANAGADSVSVYAVDATTGALTPISGSPFATGTQPTAIAISD